jgi:hypothetical protein
MMPTHTTKTKECLLKTEALLAIARRLIWWLPPEEALDFPDRFLAQVMTLGTWDDVRHLWGRLGRERFRQVLINPPPGVFDQRSWHYWHHVFRIHPVPPLPQRQIP